MPVPLAVYQSESCQANIGCRIKMPWNNLFIARLSSSETEEHGYNRKFKNFSKYKLYLYIKWYKTAVKHVIETKSITVLP